MATNEESDLIGYDPLMWMEGNADKNEGHLVTDEGDNSNKMEEQQIVADEISMGDDFSDDLTEDVEQFVVDTIEDEKTKVLEDEGNSVPADDMYKDSMATAGPQIDLDATLGIQNILKLHEKIKNILVAHDHIEINASDVSSIDTATLQLLVSLKKEAVKLQKKVTIISPSSRFVESAHLLGLLDVLGVHDV